MTRFYAKEWQAIMNDQDAANKAVSGTQFHPVDPRSVLWENRLITVIDQDQEWSK